MQLYVVESYYATDGCVCMCLMETASQGVVLAGFHLGGWGGHLPPPSR